MVDVETIISYAVTVIILGLLVFAAYKKHLASRAYQRKMFSGNKTTPEGEPHGKPRSNPRSGEFPRRITRIAITAIIGVIVLSVVLAASIKIVEAGNRGVLLRFGAVDTSSSLNEGIHFVTPLRDDVIPIEVRTQKTVESAVSASKDLQDVHTEVALNYHVSPDNAHLLFQQLGYEYSTRVISPAIQESVKQVTARFNAEELITKRETVKTEILVQINQRLASYNILVETISIT